MALVARLVSAVIVVAAMSVATATGQQLDPKVVGFKLPDQIEWKTNPAGTNRSVVLQGTVLIEDDSPVMASALRIPQGVLHEALCCLVMALGVKPSIATVRESITRGLADALGRRAENVGRLGSGRNGQALLKKKRAVEA